MSIDIVRGVITNQIATRELIKSLNDIVRRTEIDGTLYLGYPLSASSDEKVTIDALLISKQYGLCPIIYEKNINDIEHEKERQDELYYQLQSALMKYSTLRKGRGLAITPRVITFFSATTEHTIDDDYIFATPNTLGIKLQKIRSEDSEYFSVLNEALQRVSTIKPKKKRENVKNVNSRGAIIGSIEKEIANLDQWQKKAALEIPEGPQRIRGLAGSGKTIVLALKAAYLHTQYPEWDIVVTYYSRSLWQQFTDYIARFTFEFSGDQPNWKKLHVYHSWGTTSDIGLYSDIANSIGIYPMNYANARAKFGMQSAFSGICSDLLNYIPSDYVPRYDAVLIDEAQDMPASFFQIVYLATKEPKRIVWAYDELQNLTNDGMPSIKEMFGVDEKGSPKVKLANKTNEAQQDIVLPVCYRNPPWVISVAHALGFGIYNKKYGLLQLFKDLSLWGDIGYQVDSGELAYGESVSLSRRQDATPDYFNKLLTIQDSLSVMCFEDTSKQYKWMAEQIYKNIFEDELDADDILVIFPNTLSSKNDYIEFRKFLELRGISSILVGVSNERDIFRVTNSITCSHIHRAKGNEAPMVYIANSQYCMDGHDIIRRRNTLFTSITRSRAWVRICGVDKDMQELAKEINECDRKKYSLSFTIPTPSELDKLKVIHGDKTLEERKSFNEARKVIKSIRDMADKGRIAPSMLKELEILVKNLNANYPGEINEDSED